MPELPEVETIVQGLKKFLIGKKIAKLDILDKKRFLGDKKEVEGQEITDLKRRAKLIIIKLKNKYNLLIHLKMTGQLIFKDKKHKIAGGHQAESLYLEVPNKHTRIIFTLSGGGKLYYNDLIRYGNIRVLIDEEIEKISREEFGPEPFSKEFSFKYLGGILKAARTQSVKKILMEQKKIAGIGNIYANEALYFAKINPKRKSNTLSDIEIKGLYQGILKALKIGIKNQGASIRNYVNHEGKKGKMQDEFKVYNRAGQGCDCGGTIEKVQLAGRGTYFCVKCQK